LYRNLAKVASNQSPINWTVIDDPVLSSAYADYISKDMEKVANLSLLIPFLSAIFLTLPSLMALQKSTERIDKMESDNMKMIQNIKSRASEIPMLPFIPNPVYHNPLFQSNLGMEAKPVYIVNNPIKTASVGNVGRKIVNTIQGIGTKIKNKAPITFHYGVPMAAAGLTTVALAGKDKEKELNGDPTAGTGLYGMAHKHPVVTTAVGTMLGHMVSKKLVKKSSSQLQDLTDYKEFLKTASQEQLLEFLGKIPDDLFFDLIN